MVILTAPRDPVRPLCGGRHRVQHDLGMGQTSEHVPGDKALKEIGRINGEHLEAPCASLDAAEREPLAQLLQRIANEQGLRPGVHP